VTGSPQTLSEADRRLVAAWAADCAEHVLPLFEAEAPRDDRPRALIARARAFARGELGTAEGSAVGMPVRPLLSATRARTRWVRLRMPPRPWGSRNLAGQRPSKTRSAGSSTACRQRSTSHCAPSRLLVKTRRVLSGPAFSLLASSARSLVNYKPASPKPARTRPDRRISRQNAHAGYHPTGPRRAYRTARRDESPVHRRFQVAFLR
jgi:hypothetical protein